MITIENRTERKESREAYPLERLAEAALARYGLAEARIESLPGMTGLAGDEACVFGVSFPASAAEIHPYLGRLAGKSFMVRIAPSAEESSVTSLQTALKWAGEMAARCRDTDEDAPEPIPACDGSLVTLISLGNMARHCVVYR